MLGGELSNKLRSWRHSEWFFHQSGSEMRYVALADGSSCFIHLFGLATKTTVYVGMRKTKCRGNVYVKNQERLRCHGKNERIGGARNVETREDAVAAAFAET